jgi:hypothetical protein
MEFSKHETQGGRNRLSDIPRLSESSAAKMGFERHDHQRLSADLAIETHGWVQSDYLAAIVGMRTLSME